MMDARHVLERFKNRAIATILDVKERDCDEFLPAMVQVRLRKVIVDQLNDYFELANVLQESAGYGVVLNEEYLERIDRIFETLEKQAR